MELIGLTAYHQTSRGKRNAHLARTAIMPHCEENYSITKGPSLAAICNAPTNIVPWEVSKILRLHESGNLIVDGHIPLQFTLNFENTKRRVDYTSPVAVFVRSIDLAPDLAQVHWSLFRDALPMNNSHLYFSPEAIVIRGLCEAISASKHIYFPEGFVEKGLMECIIVYDPKTHEGWLGEVAAEEELPMCAVIKNLDVLHQIVRKHYLGGFIESHAPDGATRWGHVTGMNDDYVEIDAGMENFGAWEFCPKERPLHLLLVGASFVKGDGYELMGDALLCADGTILHTYHFNKDAFVVSERLSSSDVKDGYYRNRFYPPGSPMIPKRVTDSFASDMPAWFVADEEE